MNVQAWLKLDTSLQIMFKLELVIKYKTQAQYHVFELEIQHKYIIKLISNLLSSLFGLDE